METINLSDFAKAIEKHYNYMTSDVAENCAKIWYRDLDPLCYEAVQCWINGTPVPDVQYGEMSVEQILNIRCDDDELRAILLLSDYIRDHDAGMARIFEPYD